MPDFDAEATAAAVVIDRWLANLDNYNLEQLQQVPKEGGWSLGQVYAHLLMSANMFFLRNAEACIAKHKTIQKGNINLGGRLVFIFGRTPNIRVKMPDKVAVDPDQPQSKEQLKQDLEELKLRMRRLSEVLKKEFNPREKRRHPIFGPMNAWEWYRLVSIHFAHHERQKKRLDAMLSLSKVQA
jgi:hypothetical protein